MHFKLLSDHYKSRATGLGLFTTPAPTVAKVGCKQFVFLKMGYSKCKKK